MFKFLEAFFAKFTIQKADIFKNSHLEKLILYKN